MQFRTAELIKLHLDLSLFHAREANGDRMIEIRDYHRDLSERLALEAKRLAECAPIEG